MAVLDFFGFCLQLVVVMEPLNRTTSTIITTTATTTRITTTAAEIPPPSSGALSGAESGSMVGLGHSCEVTSWLVGQESTECYRLIFNTAGHKSIQMCIHALYNIDIRSTDLLCGQLKLQCCY